MAMLIRRFASGGELKALQHGFDQVLAARVGDGVKDDRFLDWDGQTFCSLQQGDALFSRLLSCSDGNVQRRGPNYHDSGGKQSCSWWSRYRASCSILIKAPTGIPVCSTSDEALRPRSKANRIAD